MTAESSFAHTPAGSIHGLLSCGDRQAIALIGREGQLSYGELAGVAARVAGGLLAAGARPGDRVASWMNKTIASAVMPFACAQAGLIHVPVNPMLKGPQVEHILADSGARLLLTLHDRAAMLAAGTGTRMLTLEGDWESLLSASPVQSGPPDPYDLACLLYTSGSTGRAKGVMLSHQNLWLGADSVFQYLGLQADDNVLALLPFSFDYGLNQMLAIFRAGGTVVLHDFLMARAAVQALHKHKITVLAGVPPLWRQLLEVEWPDDICRHLRVLTNSGGAMPQAMSAQLMARCPEARLYLMYGLTEAFRSTYLNPELVGQYPASVGKAVPHAEVLIVRPNGTPVNADEVGELVHCGPLVAQGYWNDPVRTAQRFRPAPAASRYGGTAVWSGDAATYDKNGLITFSGRMDEMIKTQGYRVSPTEVEDAAIKSGAIAEAAAFGVPDEYMGQAIHLVVTAAAGLSEGEAEQRLQQGLRADLPNFMQPAKIIWRNEMPQNPNGKLDRALLKMELQS